MAQGVKNTITTFDCLSDPSTLGKRWKRWLTSFELFADGKGLIILEGKDDNKQRRRALLLHLAGPGVQETFTTLTDTGGPKDYSKCVNALDNYFIPKVNSAYARHAFRQLKQETGETVRLYATKLKKAAQDCDYGDDTDNQIRDEIMCKCTSNYIRRKLLEEGQGLTLNRTLEIAEQCEKVETQMTALSGTSEGTESVNKLYERKQGQRQTPRQSQETGNGRQGKECYRCGQSGHFGRDPSCPARGKTCRKCNGRDHFSHVCRSRNTYRGNVNQLEEYETANREYAFHVQEQTNANTMNIFVGGICLNVLVDSGATSNIISEETWESLKAQGIVCHSSQASCGKQLYAYASKTPLEVKGGFTCDTEIGTKISKAEFLVVGGDGMSLLGCKTAKDLGVLKIGADISVVTSYSQTIQQSYPEVFKGVGRLKTRQVRLHIDPTFAPVAQPLRRTPFNLRKKVEAKIEELIDMDIIEHVNGPTPWVNPVVIVPKSNGEIRLCIDMRRANEAIVRERYPIPTVDEILQEVNGSKVFSKLDLKWGYHQLELSPESREITTFATHSGLYRYKRLLFGVNSASEQYQHEISTVIAGIEGANNISDDIVIHAKDQEEHDRCLNAVLQRLSQSGLTLNPDKCVYNMDKIIFMGMLLSEKGIGPTEGRVKAVTSAREPNNVAEVRSFLGLVNYSSRFIPGFATISEPLRRLTKDKEPFAFGPEQKKSFQALKDGLAKATTLAYFDKEAPTKVIADASPVGLGAVLVQEQNGVHVPVSYASRGLTDCERKYSQTEKEALSLVWACEKFHPYIYGMKFDLLTDHKPLEVIYGPRSKPCARIERWTLRLQPYDFKVIHIPGLQNIADPLSRLVRSEQCHKHGADQYVRFVAVNATPNAMNTREIEEISAEDEELDTVRKALQTGNYDQCKAYAPIAGELCAYGQLILRGTRIVLPSKLRPRAMALAHEGHMGIVGTKQNLRTKVWWPGMDKAAERHCRSCHGCQLMAQSDPPEPIKSTTLPEGPWKDLAADLLGPFPSGHSILVVVDYYSRYYEYSILQSTTADKIIDAMEEMFSRHGLPDTMKTDNGPQFIATEFKAFCNQNGIVHNKTTPRWAQANGEVERQNRSIVKRIKIAQAEQLDWKRELRRYVFKYRSTDHSSTGRSPAELLFNRKIKGKLPDMGNHQQLDLDARDRDSEQKGKAKIYADDQRDARPSPINVGDQVLVKEEQKNKFSTNFKPIPHTVVERKGSEVTVQSPEGNHIRRNSTCFKKYETDGTLQAPTNAGTHVSPDEVQQAGPALTRLTEDIEEPAQAEQPQRPQRSRSAPEKFKDFIMTLIGLKGH